jgi:hypothetical protein
MTSQIVTIETIAAAITSPIPTHLVLDGLVPAPRGHILRHDGWLLRSKHDDGEVNRGAAK